MPDAGVLMFEPLPSAEERNRTDLVGDGHDEVVVWLMGSFFCGTGGCNLQVDRSTGGLLGRGERLPDQVRKLSIRRRGLPGAGAHPEAGRRA